MTFGEWLLERITERGMSYTEIGKLAGYSHARISQVVNGDLPSEKFCVGIARALGLPPVLVLGEGGHVPRQTVDEKRRQLLLYWFDKMPTYKQDDFIRQARVVAEGSTDYETGELGEEPTE